jgi:hypothetical protein
MRAKVSMASGEHLLRPPRVKEDAVEMRAFAAVAILSLAIVAGCGGDDTGDETTET